jgi:hypothetical protein
VHDHGEWVCAEGARGINLLTHCYWWCAGQKQSKTKMSCALNNLAGWVRVKGYKEPDCYPKCTNENLENYQSVQHGSWNCVKSAAGTKCSVECDDESISVDYKAECTNKKNSWKVKPNAKNGVKCEKICDEHTMPAVSGGKWNLIDEKPIGSGRIVFRKKS